MIKPKENYILAEIRELKESGIIIAGNTKATMGVYVVDGNKHFKKGSRVYVKSDAKLYPVRVDKKEKFLLHIDDVIAEEINKWK